MVGRAIKRSPEDCVSDDTKKKKISKEKRETEVLKDKTKTTICRGDSRQKKAFFAYFGKSFCDDENNGVDNGVDTKKPVVESETTTNKNTVDTKKCSRLLADELKNVIYINKDISRSTNTCFVKYVFYALMNYLILLSCNLF